MKICVFRQIELYDLSVFFCGTKVNHVSMTAWKMKKACLPQAYSNNVIEVSTSFNLIECLSLSPARLYNLFYANRRTNKTGRAIAERANTNRFGGRQTVNRRDSHLVPLFKHSIC